MEDFFAESTRDRKLLETKSEFPKSEFLERSRAADEEDGPETLYSTEVPRIETPTPIELPKLISYCFLLTVFLAFSVHMFLARQIRS